MKVNIEISPECTVGVEQRELNKYIERAEKKFGDKCVGINIKALNDDDVEISYELTDRPFERIRRITGYLVGTLDRWNDAKQAEEKDRVKHEV